MKLNAQTIRKLALPPGKSEAILFDSEVPGFGIRLRKAGSRTLVFQYEIGDRQRRMTLGPATAVDIGKARETAKDLYAQVRLGRDPAEKAQSRVVAGETFEAAAKLFLARQRARLRPKTYVDVERHLLKHARSLHSLPLVAITRRNIATVITTVADNRGPTTGNRVRTSLSAFFSWCVKQGMVEANPVTGTGKNDERSRNRVLSSAELRAIWNALAEDQYGAILKLLMLTGARATEISELCWAEIEGDKIVLAGERTKNHRPHIIPLSGPACAILEAWPRRDGHSFVFGRTAGPFSGWSKSKAALDARIADTVRTPLPDWRVHDVRRTFATHAAEIGIQPHVIEACLNHVSGHRAGVAGIYNRALYETEKRRALELWADQLLAWVNDRESNIAPMRRPA